MIKAFLVTFLLVGLCVLLVWSDILNLFTGNLMFYMVWVLVLILLGLAFIILGNPLAKRTDDDKKSD